MEEKDSSAQGFKYFSFTGPGGVPLAAPGPSSVQLGFGQAPSAAAVHQTPYPQPAYNMAYPNLSSAPPTYMEEVEYDEITYEK